MAVIETRGSMNRKRKVWGILPDRVIVGGHVADRTFAPLSLTDHRKDFIFLDFKFDDALIKTSGMAYFRSSTTTLNSAANGCCVNLGCGLETFAQDRHTPPLCYSSCLSGIRDYYTGHNYINNHLGQFKGPSVIFTVDNTGLGTDYMVPGMKLMVSPGGVVHKYVTNEAVDVLKHKTVNNNDPWNNNYSLNNCPMCIGHNSRTAVYGYPTRAIRQSDPTGQLPQCSQGNPSRMNHIIFSRFIGQDATYIYYLQYYDDYSTVNNYQYNYSYIAPPDLLELISIRKSDSFLTDIPMTSAQVNAIQSIGGNLIAEVVTTEATPKRAIYTVLFPSYQKQSVVFGKVVDNTFVNIGSLNFPSFANNNYKTYPTRLMEHKQSGYTDYWKFYVACASNTDNAIVPIMIRQRKTLAVAPTQTSCTITGLPAEYASTDGLKIKPQATTNIYDAAWAAEIYDDTDQYLAYWIGRTHTPVIRSDADTYSYSEVSDTKYRYFLVFKIDPTDDTKLIYQSSVPEFKNAKPIHCSVASPDNKQIVVANDDGIMCLVWSTVIKGYVCVDNIAMPGVIALGMDEVNSTGRNTVWAEVLENTTSGNDCKSYLVQIDFGDYEDVDLRYYTGTVYISDFGKITLPVSKVGNEYEAKTATFEVRVKNKVNTVETVFVTGKSVRLKIEGVKVSDEVSFVGNDSGIPLQKTITSTSDWLTFTINYKYPITNFKITSEII